MSHQYLGPADNLEYPNGSGRYYKPGDAIPLTVAERDHLARFGHRFEDMDPATDAVAAQVLGPVAPTPEPVEPRGDRGEVVASRETRRAAPAAKSEAANG